MTFQGWMMSKTESTETDEINPKDEFDDESDVSVYYELMEANLAIATSNSIKPTFQFSWVKFGCDNLRNRICSGWTFNFVFLEHLFHIFENQCLASVLKVGTIYTADIY